MELRFRNSFLVPIVIAYILSLFGNAYGQEKEKPALVEQAEELAASFVQMRLELPDRWAAWTDIRIENTPDSKEMFVSHIREFTAFDAKHHIRVCRRIDAESSVEPATTWTNQEFIEAGWFSKKETLQWDYVKKQWVVVKKFANRGRPFSDPFSWSVGYLNSYEAGVLNSEMLPLIFYNSGRECLSAIDTKKGLFAFWGKPFASRQLVCTFSILFAKETSLPIEINYDAFEKGYDPNVLSESSSIAKTYIKWKKVSDKLFLPIEVDSIGENGSGPFEMKVEIKWILGDDVPTSTFEDPRLNNQKPIIR